MIRKINKKKNTRKFSIRQNPNGLFFRPQDCNSPAGYKLAIIIPFRDTTAKAIRVQQLKFLLFYMIPILIRQKLTFRFYIVNQTTGSPFNRAKLLNIGFLEASQILVKMFSGTYFILF